jgi:uncharacterized protein YdcH (DUF465 family)
MKDESDIPTEGEMWEAAEEQALTESENEAEEGYEPPEPVIIEPGSDDESEEDAEELLAEDGDEQPEASMDAEEEPEETQKAETWTAEQWDGNPDSLPDDIKKVFEPVHRVMERGMHKKFQELAALRKEYEDKLARLPGDPAPAPAAQSDAPPPVPTAEMTQEEQNAAWDARDAYFARKAVEEQVKLSGPPEEVQEVVEMRRAEKRLNGMRERLGYDPDVEVAMRQLTQAHPYYGRLFEDDEGMDVLFHTAKTALENAKLQEVATSKKQVAAQDAEAKIKKKASAAKGAVSRPGNPRNSTPADNYANWGFEEAERAALEALERS